MDPDCAPIVPSCPAWSVPDLVVHLGEVHRMVTVIIRDRRALVDCSSAGAATLENVA